MLKAISNGGFSLLEKLVTRSFIQKMILKLPFNQIQKGSLTLELFGATHRFEGVEPGYHADLVLKKPFRAYLLMKTQGELGFAQAYFEHAVDSHSLYQLMHLVYQNQAVLDDLLANTKFNLWHLWQHKKRHNSIENSRKNISYHYDLGNDFYQMWLDKTMSYSSAIFSRDDQTLEEAQQQKYQRLIKEIDLKAGQDVLEIGCGWGGFMEAAIHKGAAIKGLTLSIEQRDFALRRLQNQAVDGQFEVVLQDYRHEVQQYDHIVSIEMFEAVGKEYWDVYFAKLNECLKDHGKVALQVITINERFAELYQDNVDFIQTYIFPGGLLPSLTQLKQLATKHGFKVDNVFDFGQDYAKTCRLWKQDFNKHSQTLLEQGYDKSFQKMWNYYLDYCTVGFETQHSSVVQLTLSKQERVEEAL
ncbi:cyclopropane-fatty-acyl-phospholipid synthase [Thiomicrorhabdus immobilis]|uniref:Cyclopropane-fatty-acyl-phospholipid synthase n=1 Tax=Thiomicrorhabdus immobilis TaxID=2791037 RepID=A0ABM7MFS5_9GAMM|nr:cyclopropane-fatty-acyl-phospholipid synthase family protein [Thiomicrorhabdus immobilis]BCN94358.1 cyclopropane-fatty-acyl-phospholipid synthase [Thiomicrorhabdus immobilis]